MVNASATANIRETVLAEKAVTATLSHQKWGAVEYPSEMESTPGDGGFAIRHDQEVRAGMGKDLIRAHEEG